MTLDTIGSGGPIRAPHRTHLLLAAQAYERILTGRAPADAILRELFLQHRGAGARDRGAIGDLVYGTLRAHFPLRAALGDSASPLELCAALALRTHGRGAMPALRELDWDALAARLGAAPAIDDATAHNLPAWLWAALAGQYGPEAAALAEALNRPAQVDLRANALKGSRELAIAALAEDGIAAQPLPTPHALRLPERAPLQRTRAFREGLVEPQDEGSQRLALFCAPKPGDTVIDWCAGAGGKTLALGALMKDRGLLQALDVNRARLAGLAPRLQRSGLTIVRTALVSDPAAAALKARADLVLVDAPCSATGTLRRNPELRLRTPDLAALAATQLGILAAAARAVKPGGTLVYATCSVLRQENEDVVAAFLGTTGGFAADGPPLVLLPHRDGCDGFYAQRLTLSSRA